MRDIGALEGPVLCFGGPYGNLQATAAVLARAGELGIPVERVICTGDVVAYCGDPEATVDAIRAAGCHAIMGNCEQALGFDLGECGCGFAPESACAALAERWFSFASAVVDGTAKAWMRSLPRTLRFTLGGRRLAVIHGGVRDVSRFVFASTPATVKREELAALGPDGAVDGVVAGHAGLPFTRVVGRGEEAKLWHNAGAAGLPANDGTPRIWYSILAPQGSGLRISHHALVYDHRRAAARMRERGLPEAYARALETGLWPSMDVLPAAERRRRGRALRPKPALWPAAGAGRRQPPGQNRHAY